jgi:hypothetical protein
MRDQAAEVELLATRSMATALSHLPEFEDVLDVVLRREAEARVAFEAASGHEALPRPWWAPSFGPK